ncbi:V-type proton ATPase 16 kDa proteolipid subunit [Armadillidium vulgare]|nr:V-type proton ATPase 16 kDa proteolipid subunit [Armadillidium vulgare]
MADITSNTSEKKKDPFVGLETEESIQADPSPSSEDALSKFEEMLYTSKVYIGHLIAKSPETFKTLREKLPEVIEISK